MSKLHRCCVHDVFELVYFITLRLLNHWQEGIMPNTQEQALPSFFGLFLIPLSVFLARAWGEGGWGDGVRVH